MSTFAAQFMKRLRPRIQAVLERDVNTRVAALDASLDLFPDEDCIGFRTPTALAVNFPCLYLEGSQVDLSQSADDSRVDQQHELVISVACVGPDDYTLQSALETYVLAIDQALRRMTIGDLTGGITSAVSPAAWEVTQHRYGVLRGTNNNTILRRDAQLILVIQFFER